MRKIFNSGFTLIELLVVISIIGILTTLLFANFMGVRERGRDTQRKSNLAQIQRALELYKSAQSPVSYPATSGWQNTLETGGFMKQVPHDPMFANDWPDYYYARGTTDTLTYKLVVCLENASDPQKDSAIDSHCNGKPASLTRTEP